MTNTTKIYRRGDFAAVPTTTPGLYQVVNTRTGRRSEPRPVLRALRILVKAARRPR